jgi:hypothetical protein
MRREGLEPPEPDGIRSTAGPAPSYGLPPRVPPGFYFRTLVLSHSRTFALQSRGRDSNPRRLAPPVLQTGPFGRSGTPASSNPSTTSTPGGIRTPDIRIWSHGALPAELQAHTIEPPPSTPGGIRTPDTRFWRPVLYQLSYRRIPSIIQAPGGIRTPVLRIRNPALWSI